MLAMIFHQIICKKDYQTKLRHFEATALFIVNAVRASNKKNFLIKCRFSLR
jgi:hypothetical protein